MNWTTIRLILARELRDQVRDRRTLFTVAVLPLMLYPLMGISLIQITQFFREHPTQIWIVGQENLPAQPALLEGSRIAETWSSATQRRLLELNLSDQSDAEFQRLISEFKRDSSSGGPESLINAYIQQELARHQCDLAVLIPKPLAAPPPGPISETEPTPSIYLFLNTASDRSRIAAERMQKVLNEWKAAYTQFQLEHSHLSARWVDPFLIRATDVADQVGRRAAAWSKILPLLVMIWCLTGAFYPAVDLCAGEKERGTFETLLSSPASRTEIAFGKLLTVILFSMATCLLNLLSMGVTSSFVLGRMGSLASTPLTSLEVPPLLSLLWLIPAIVPIAALFSALSLAAAAFARSSKEGQYYLVPLIMICMPLVAIPILPATRLELGTSLIPVTGLMLLLRALIEGNYTAALQFFGPVVSVTLVCGWLAVRWVVAQFNSETVLFRASERFSLTRWLRSAFLLRNDLPTTGQALLCGMVILLAKFFVSFSVSLPRGFGEFAWQTVIILFATVALPAILMALMLTRQPAAALKLKPCRPGWIAAAILMAAGLHPIFTALSSVVMYLYPTGDSLGQMQQMLGQALAGAPSFWMVLIVLAVVPALFEELTYRGFILSGLQQMRSAWPPVVIASLFFGFAHAVFQQTLLAFFVGLVLGAISWRTASLWPCLAYHAVHNTLSLLLGEIGYSDWGAFGWLVRPTESGAVVYRWDSGLLLATTGILLLVWLMRQNSEKIEHRKSEREEALLGHLPLLAR